MNYLNRNLSKTPPHICAFFSDKSYLLNASSQELRFTFILSVKISGDIMNFWQFCDSAENSHC